MSQIPKGLGALEIDRPLEAGQSSSDSSAVTEGEEALFGTNFGIVTHIETGPDGALYLVSPSAGSIRKISRN